MTFGYNINLCSTMDNSIILDYGKNLVRQLENARSSAEVLVHSLGVPSLVLIIFKEKTRPIIFLGHSLGGILILQVITLLLSPFALSPRVYVGYGSYRTSFVSCPASSGVATRTSLVAERACE